MESKGAGIHTAKLFAYRQWCTVSCHSREAVDFRSPGGAGEWGGGPPGRPGRGGCDTGARRRPRAQQGPCVS